MYPTKNTLIKIPPGDHGWVQHVDLEAGNLQAEFTLYAVRPAAMYLYHVLSVASLGAVPLFFHWLPHCWLYVFARSTSNCSHHHNVWVLAKNSWDQIDVIPLTKIVYDGHFNNVFNSTNSHAVPVLYSFVYRSLAYFWNTELTQFVCTNVWKDQLWAQSHRESACFSDLVVDERRVVFGFNSVLVPNPSTFHLFVNEILHPFTVFQIFSIVLWSVNNYYYYAIAIGTLTLFSAISTLQQTKKNIHRLRNLAKYDHPVSVLRKGGHIVTQSSELLVPGDIVQIDTDALVPCDMLIIVGDAIVDESMLTGEAVPVPKTSTSVADLLDCNLSQLTFPQDVSKSVLFQGTKLVRARGLDGKHAFGLVIRTGFNTAKGALIRSIMYPAPQNSAMVRDAFMFLGVMAVFGAIGVCYTIIIYALDQVSVGVILIRSLDVLTIVVPPALPATLSAGISFALNRLRPKSIFCTSPNHIAKAGQIRTVVFDKTGTVTEDGLQVVGVIQRKSSDLISDPAQLLDNTIAIGMACCHDVKMIQHATEPSKMVGDPLDVNMVQWIGAKIIDSVTKGVHISLNSVQFPVVKVFEFNSVLRRMAVVVELDSSTRVFVKGAPETIESICLPSTIPSNYKTSIDSYAHQGLRVLALANRTLTSDLISTTRTQIETDLEFLGFVVFENPIKPGSRHAIETLRTANIRCPMCTGDNLLTAVSVARQARMLDPTDRVYAPTDAHTWESIDEPNHKMTAVPPIQPGTALAITGDVFESLVQQNFHSELTHVLDHAVVFARMTPEHKRLLVDLLRDRLGTGDGIAFCGDGANDCAALKAADVGLSLSDAEASIAAPFTSADRDLGCVVTLIQQGRAALVTANSCFKFMACYSICQFTSVCVLYTIRANLGDFQFLYIDLIIVLPLAMSMTRSEASSSLSATPPPARLMSKPILVSVVSSMLLQMGFQLIMFFIVRIQPWYAPTDVDPENRVVACFEGTSVYYMTCFMYMAMAVCFTAGEPYRTNPIKNLSFVAVLVTVFTLTLALANVTDNNVERFFDTLDFYDGWQWVVLGIAAVYAAMVLVIERFSSKLAL